MNTKGLPGKVVCITGAAGGIGSAIALAFAEAGANLALLDINEEGLSHLAEELRGRRTPSVTVSTAVADLSTERGVKSGIEEVLSPFGSRIDVLVANVPLYRCSSLCIKRGAFRGTPLIDGHGLNMLIPRGVPRRIVNRSNVDALTILSVLVRSDGASIAS